MKDSHEIYINLNMLSGIELIELWNFVFDRANQFSLRFPNCNHSTSNTMKIKYNDNAEIDENFCSYIEKNKRLINECSNNLINKNVTNKYLDDKYANLSVVYHCKMFEYLKKSVFNKPNLFDWLEPDSPEDLSFYINGKLFVYVCSHEDICRFFVNSKDKEFLLKFVN